MLERVKARLKPDALLPERLKGYSYILAHAPPRPLMWSGMWDARPRHSICPQIAGSLWAHWQTRALQNSGLTPRAALTLCADEDSGAANGRHVSRTPDTLTPHRGVRQRRHHPRARQLIGFGGAEFACRC